MKLHPLFDGELRYDESTEAGVAAFGKSGDIAPTPRAMDASLASDSAAGCGGRIMLAAGPTASACPTFTESSRPRMEQTSSFHSTATTLASGNLRSLIRFSLTNSELHQRC